MRHEQEYSAEVVVDVTKKKFQQQHAHKHYQPFITNKCRELKQSSLACSTTSVHTPATEKEVIITCSRGKLMTPETETSPLIA